MRRSLLGLAALAFVIAAGIPAAGSAQGGPCSPSSPQYCPPPKVRTGPAKHVTSTSATLTGTVNPNGSATSCYFEYGRTKQYGSTTPAQNEGSGSQTVKVSATITGLMPHTVYHYQLVCTNLGGKATGGDRRFRTRPKPHKPGHVKTGPAKHVRSRSATLTGRVTPDGSPTTCWFKYGRTKGYGATTPARKMGSGTRSRKVGFRVHHLVPKTIYHYRLVCRNALGRAHGRDRHFETRNRISFRGHRTIRVSKDGTFAVRLHCGGSHKCVGVLTVTGRGGKRLADPVHYTVRAHSTARITAQLTSAALKRLAQRHHLRARLHARNGDGSSANRRVRLRMKG